MRQGIPTMPSRSLSRIQIGGNVGRDANREERERGRNSLRVAASGETFQRLNESSNVSDSVYTAAQCHLFNIESGLIKCTPATIISSTVAERERVNERRAREPGYI